MMKKGDKPRRWGWIQSLSRGWKRFKYYIDPLDRETREVLDKVKAEHERKFGKAKEFMSEIERKKHEILNAKPIPRFELGTDSPVKSPDFIVDNGDSSRTIKYSDLFSDDLHGEIESLYRDYKLIFEKREKIRALRKSRRSLIMVNPLGSTAGRKVFTMMKVSMIDDRYAAKQIIVIRNLCMLKGKVGRHG